MEFCNTGYLLPAPTEESSLKASLYFRCPHGSIAAHGDRYIADKVSAVWKFGSCVQATYPKYEPALQSFLLDCFEHRTQQGFAARATALLHKEQQGAAGPNWELKVSKCWIFPYKVTPEGQRQLSAHHHTGGGLSEELGIACSDLGKKTPF